MRFVPNAITITRILVTPVLLILLWQGTLWTQLWALVLFILAAISDYWDGRLARSLQVRSRLGQFLDPLADKVLVLGTLVVLALLIPAAVPWWAVALIALRDVVVTGMRTWAESRGRSLRTLGVAKMKTAAQLTLIITLMVLLVAAKLPGPVGQTGRWLLESPIPFILTVAAVVLTVYTGIVYLLRQDYQTPIELNG